MSTLRYLRDPAAIYQLSFETIRREMDLGGLAKGEEQVAVRIAHACGMTDVAQDLRFSSNLVGAARQAIANGRSIFTDVEMVASAIARKQLPADNQVICTLNDPRTPELAVTRGTTRSAAALSLWQDQLEDSVVLIGNAPTALFALLETIDAGGPKPTALFAFPVGFVGAAESKAELVRDDRGLEYVTLLGRRGGSAIAAAAFNAILIGARDR